MNTKYNLKAVAALAAGMFVGWMGVHLIVTNWDAIKRAIADWIS